LSPYPAAWTTLLNNDTETEMKIYSSRKQREDHNLKIGSIISTKKELKIAVKKGYILLDEIQLSGKRKMKTQDLLNGYKFTENAKVL
jgi:methionyl-tRNA formyltransferase